MSLRCMSWVFSESNADGFARLVLLAVADEADDDGGNAFPSQQRIADKAHVSKRTVQRSLAELEQTGELLIERPDDKGRGHVWTYTVLMGRSAEQLEEGRAARLFDVRAKGKSALARDKRTATKGAEGRALLPKSRPTQYPILNTYESAVEAAAALRERHSLPPCDTCDSTGWVLGEQAEPCRACGRLEAESA